MNASLQVSATCSKDFSHSAVGTPCRILTDASAWSLGVLGKEARNCARRASQSRAVALEVQGSRLLGPFFLAVRAELREFRHPKPGAEDTELRNRWQLQHDRGF